MPCLLGVGLASATSLSLAADPKSSEVLPADYLQALEVLEAKGASVEPGSALERQAIEAFEALLSDLKAEDFGERVPQVYAEGAVLDDSLKVLRGAVEIEEYFKESAEALEKGRLEFLSTTSDGQGNYYFRWRSTMRFERFDRKGDLQSLGITHVRFDATGKVVLQKDFWDTSQGLFEHLPVVGWLIRRIKRRL